MLVNEFQFINWFITRTSYSNEDKFTNFQIN